MCNGNMKYVSDLIQLQRGDREGLFTSPIYRTHSYIPTLQPSIVMLKMAASAEHLWIMWYFYYKSTQFNFGTEL